VTGLTPADILSKAADVIAANGWIRFGYFDTEQADTGVPLNKCRVCVMGAIGLVTENHPIPVRYLDPGAALDAVAALQSHVGNAPDAWNDHTPNLTSADVIDTLRQVAAKLREQQ
jgi:hypothetical protein